jgi:hypothetical protein
MQKLPALGSTKTNTAKEITNDAHRLLSSPTFFSEMLCTLGRLGLVGEGRNAGVLYVAATSRVLSRPLNVIVKGRSSSGKNFLVNRVLTLFPKDSIREITSSSEHAWNYAKDDFKHRVVYLQERNEAAGNIHPARLLISEGKLIRIVTNNDGGVYTTKRQVTEGPISCISTTTKNRLEMDDETRNISLWIDESEEQTKRIAQSYFVSTGRPNTREVLIWKRAQRLIERRSGRLEVVIPAWFSQVADGVFAGDIRVRRYFGAFVEACRALALIHSFRTNPAQVPKRIEVDFADFATAAILFEHVFVESLHLGDDKNLATRQAIVRWIKITKRTGMRAADLAKAMRITRHTAYARLRRAVAAGMVKRVNTPEKGNLKLFALVPLPRFLPNPSTIFSAIPRLGNRIEFVHPLTGAAVKFVRERLPRT